MELNVAECDADADLQRQLVTEIRRASPLPPPPRPDLFAAKVQLIVGHGIDVQLQ